MEKIDSDMRMPLDHAMTVVKVNTSRKGGNFRHTYLPRVSASQMLLLIQRIRESLNQGLLRFELAELIRKGYGVPNEPGLQAILCSSISSDFTEEKREELLAVIQRVEDSVNYIKDVMSPWGFIPSCDWVMRGIGHDVWPFFFKHPDSQKSVTDSKSIDVPPFAARVALVYVRSKTDPSVYQLRDSYMLVRSRKVAIPTLFLHQGDDIVPGIKSEVKLKSKHDRIAVFGVLYFTGSEDQKKDLRTCYDIDCYATMTHKERKSISTPEIVALIAEQEQAKSREEKARAYLDRYSEDPAMRVRCKRADECLQRNESAKLAREIRALREIEASKLNPLARIRFKALDLLLPTSYRHAESEWRTLTCAGGERPKSATLQLFCSDEQDESTAVLKYKSVNNYRYW